MIQRSLTAILLSAGLTAACEVDDVTIPELVAGASTSAAGAAGADDPGAVGGAGATAPQGGAAGADATGAVGGAGATAPQGGAAGAACVIPDFAPGSPEELGIPFVRGVMLWSEPLPTTDLTDLDANRGVVTFPEPGKVCVAGTVVTGDAANLLLVTGQPLGSERYELLDLAALGAEFVRFDLEWPAQDRWLEFDVSTAEPTGCVYDTQDMFGLISNGKHARWTGSGTSTLPLADFEYYWGAHPDATLDLTRVVKLAFSVPGLGDFEFCFSNVQFRDGDGAPSEP